MIETSSSFSSSENSIFIGPELARLSFLASAFVSDRFMASMNDDCFLRDLFEAVVVVVDGGGGGGIVDDVGFDAGLEIVELVESCLSKMEDFLPDYSHGN